MWAINKSRAYYELKGKYCLKLEKLKKTAMNCKPH